MPDVLRDRRLVAATRSGEAGNCAGRETRRRQASSAPPIDVLISAASSIMRWRLSSSSR